MRFDQTIRNLTSGDSGTPLVVIPLAVTRLKKIRVAYLLQLFQGNEEKGLHDLVCGAPLDNWANVGLF